MPIRLRRLYDAALVVLVILILAACSASNASDSSTSASGGSCTPSDSPTITFLAYSTPQEVYDAKIIPAFKSMWKDEHDGQIVNFLESYGPSTTQAQNVVNGQPADVVALSLAPDVDTIEQAGLITHDWTDAPDGGMVSSSVVVFDVRPGNPKGIKDWNDLAEARHPGPHARPRPERRRALEPRVHVGLRAPRRRARHHEERRVRRHQADERRDRQRGRLRQLGPELDPELRGRQRRRGHHLRERGEDGRRRPDSRTRPSTPRGRS